MRMRSFFKFLSLSMIGLLTASGAWKENPTVHVFGDSHSKKGFSTIKGCKVHRLGPITMHRIGRDSLSFLDVAKFDVKENDTAVFVFGEIDVRCHIGKQRDLKGRDLDDIIDTLVKRYLATILENRNAYASLHCVVFAVIPPTNGAYNPKFPIHGTLEDRISITKKLNAKLAEECAKNDVALINVYDDFATPRGDLLPHLSDGTVHIEPKYNGPIRTQLSNLLKKYYKQSI